MTTLRIQLPTFRTSAPRGADLLAGAAYALWYVFDLMVSARKPNSWTEQFSPASLDESRARDTVDALQRANAVRL